MIFSPVEILYTRNWKSSDPDTNCLLVYPQRREEREKSEVKRCGTDERIEWKMAEGGRILGEEREIRTQFFLAI